MSMPESRPRQLQRRVRLAHWLVRWTVRLLLRLIWRIRVEGLEHVPKSGGAVIACNHHSYVDGLVLGAFLPRASTMLIMAELYQHRLLARLFNWFGYIPVDRQSPSSGHAAVQAGQQSVSHGGLCGVFI